MKTLRNTILLSAFVLFLAMGHSLRAQNMPDNYDLMKDHLNAYMVLASQAQGTCQQVETFASNGNMHRLLSSMGGLSRAMSEINLTKMEMARTSIPDRIIFDSIRNLVSGIEEDAGAWDAAQRADYPTVGVIAAALRESLQRHKSEAAEIRVAICCRMD